MTDPTPPVVPVLLSGGSGTRLWPVSRKSFPKQFAPLVGEESLFQASARRLSGARYAAPLILTGADFRFNVTEQLAGVPIPASAWEFAAGQRAVMVTVERGEARYRSLGKLA